jgi:hypothetical protein
MNTKLTRPSPAYWSDRNVMLNLRIALNDLTELEQRFRGTPRWYPYSQAGDALYELGLRLREQLKADDRNPYWRERPAVSGDSTPAHSQTRIGEWS